MTSFLINPYRFGGVLPWTPANITTALWLDAADTSTITTVSGAVSQWNDKSGNGYHAVQATASKRPTYLATGLNSIGALSFNKLQIQNLRTPEIAGNGISAKSLSIIQVIKPSTGWGGLYLSSIGTRLNTPINGSWWSFIRANNSNEIGFHGAAQYWSSSNLFNNSTILCDVVTGGTVLDSWANGSQIQAARTIAAFTTRNNNFLDVGTGSQPSTDEAFDGLIVEVILVDAATSSDTRQRIEGYLAHKWGLTGSLPAGHPYKTTAPTV